MKGHSHKLIDNRKKDYHWASGAWEQSWFKVADKRVATLELTTLSHESDTFLLAVLQIEQPPLAVHSTYSVVR